MSEVPCARAGVVDQGQRAVQNATQLATEEETAPIMHQVGEGNS